MNVTWFYYRLNCKTFFNECVSEIVFVKLINFLTKRYTGASLRTAG